MSKFIAQGDFFLGCVKGIIAFAGVVVLFSRTNCFAFHFLPDLFHTSSLEFQPWFILPQTFSIFWNEFSTCLYFHSFWNIIQKKKKYWTLFEFLQIYFFPSFTGTYSTITPCKSKVYNMLIWYAYLLWNDCHTFVFI